MSIGEPINEVEIQSPPSTEVTETPEQVILRLQQEIETKNNQITSLQIDLVTRTKERDIAIEKAGIDPLTELLNRRAGEERATELLAQAARGEIALVYVRLDIDHFKEINDSQGHPWGDSILKGLADKLKETKRNTDTIFRYGGEEIDLILPMKANISPIEVGIAVNRYLDAIHTLYRNEHESNEIPANPEPLTASFGAAIILQGEDITLEEAQKMADLCVYQSKNLGRDRITINSAHELFLRKSEQLFWTLPRANENFYDTTLSQRR